MNTSQPSRGSGNVVEPPVPELDASRFEMLEPVGSGGMGTVYRAVQRSVGRHVAVKVLAPEHAANATGLARFVREANVIARLTHPNIVQLIDFGRDREGRLLLVMELLEGESLRATLRREGRLAPERAVYVAVQCLNALRVSHAAGVVHRDLKPENIFMHRAGDDDHVKVLDFGVAKLTEGDASDSNTTQGSLVGTLRYMAPEQIAGEVPDLRIDVYSVGMVLYELLAGTMPYDTRDRYVLLRQIIAEEPAHLLTRVADVSPALADVVMRAIQKSPRDRFQSADEFRRALTPFLNGDHARLQALSDASGRPVSTGTGPFGDIRSGIVRSGHLQVAAGSMHGPNTGFEATISASSSGAPYPGHPSAVSVYAPSQPGHTSMPGYASGPGYHPGTVAPVAPQPAAPAGGNRLLLVLLGLVLVLVAALAAVLTFRDDRPVATVDSTPRVTPPTTPTPTPEPPPTPTPTRMVLVSTTPPGAQVLDANGQPLCAATPCAIPVPVGRMLPVRIMREGVTLHASLDPNAPNVAIDLSALAVPISAVDAGERRRNVERRRNPGNGRNPSGSASTPSGEDLPMFLPH